MRLLTALLMCLMFGADSKAQDADVAKLEKETTVTMALTKLDVGDENLQLSWRVRNDTDHDVWICNSLHPDDPPSYEYFLDKDDKTLVIRKRFGLAIRERLRTKYPPLTSRYICLGSGQEKTESLSLAMPVGPYRISAGESGNAEYAKRLAIEIGYYDEDLPGLILRIVELAEKVNCDLNVGAGDFTELADRFFSGWGIAKTFKHSAGFRESVISDDGKVNLRYMGNGLNGEQVLRIAVDGLRIPYHDWNAADEN